MKSSRSAWKAPHEIAHILLGHLEPGDIRFDEDVEVGAGDIEAAANDHAGRWIFPDGLTMAGKITITRILQTAAAVGVHPCFVIGRLHHDGVLTGGAFRRSIPKVRPFLGLS